MPGNLSTYRSTGRHLHSALRPGLPWTQLLPGMSLSQRGPLQPADWAVQLRSWLHGGAVSGFVRGRWAVGTARRVGVPRLTPLGAQVPRGVPGGPLRTGLCGEVRLRPRGPLLPQRRVSVRTRLHRGPLHRAPLPRRLLRPQLPDALRLRPRAQPQVGWGPGQGLGRPAGEALGADAT